MSTPMISLDYIGGLGIIILCPSGVRYTNQVGGVATLFPEVEGVYVPLKGRYRHISQDPNGAGSVTTALTQKTPTRLIGCWD